MSITEVTIAAGWITGLAIVALIATGWRKPARATADPARARHPSRAAMGMEVTAVPIPLSRRHTPWWRRILAVFSGSVLAVLMGAVVATIVGVGAAYLVITLTSMLKR